MKKIIGAVFCVLLGCSAMVQSCKKPDAAPDPVVPVVPVVPPVDSTNPSTPTVPLTEQEIIQKAIKDFSGAYTITESRRDITDFNTYKLVGTMFVLDLDTNGLHTDKKTQINHPNLALPNFEYFYIGGFKMLRSENPFYKKIFVDEVGDSFIGAMCARPEATRCGDFFDPKFEHNVDRHAQDYDTISSNSFSYFISSFNLPADPVRNDKWAMLPVHAVKYYYNKDSIDAFHIRYFVPNGGSLGPNRRWFEDVRTLTHVYGKKLQ